MDATTDTDLLDENQDNGLAQQEEAFRSAAQWFYWVAALSIVNSIIVMAGGEWGFIFGLAATTFFDALAVVILDEFQANAVVVWGFALTANLLITGGVALLGWLALRRHQWAYVLGLAFYLGDALLMLLVGDLLALAFHGWVLLGLFTGWSALRKLRAAEPVPVPGMVPMQPS